MIVIPQERTQPIMKVCKCQEVNKTQKQWIIAGLNPKDVDKTFTTFKAETDVQKRMKDTATNYCIKFKGIKRENQNSIALLGNPGSGKTHLSIAIGVNLLSKGVKVVYMPYITATTTLKQYAMDPENYQRQINKYLNAELLLIDDLFKETRTSADKRIMFEIINHRDINKLPIIVSSECRMEDLLDIDEAIGSRINKMCKYYLVEVIGIENNYRLK